MLELRLSRPYRLMRYGAGAAAPSPGPARPVPQDTYQRWSALPLVAWRQRQATPSNRPSPLDTGAHADRFGADVNPTGNRIGGGEGYTLAVKRSEARFMVATKAQLLDALSKAEAGDVVWVESQAHIDMTGEARVSIPAGVTIASGRGEAGSPGGLIFTRQTQTEQLFRTRGDARITGVRLQGPHPGTEKVPEGHNSVGLYAKPDHFLEVDNCEVYGWSFAGLMAGQGWVHHSHIHHNQQDSLGYGVFVTDGPGLLIEANHFDYNRHSIANLGGEGVRYEARYNVNGAHMNGYAFDVHEQRWDLDRNSEFYAGDWVHIHHNTFLDTKHRAIKIRGNPRSKSLVHHNMIMRTDTPVFQANGSRNLELYDNAYGPEKRVDSVPLHRRYQEVHYRGVLKNPKR